ncbi:sigma factor-like helix-turn-helix DNA-binding protein [Streptomyces pseudovenezuelae]|uniref:sigma factor-like helix-turn-helix DNA-binding protein n=1 Tax=Streptomyces pseudovenezuelae TaxID=67350 RepID=UPI0034A5C99F
MSRSEAFEEVRSLLLSIAYRITGDVDAAQEAVEETWRCYESAPAVPAPAKAFLAAEVTRLSWEIMRSPRLRRQVHGPGSRLVEPGTGPLGDSERSAESLSTAAVLLLERLSPRQRAMYVLQEVFRCEAAQVASAMGCSEADCRRLAASVTALTGTGGRAVIWPKRIIGTHQVARAFAAIFPALRSVGVTVQPQDDVHGDPGMTFHDRHGTLLAALSLDILDGCIRTIYWITGPEDLDDIREAV